MSNPAFGVSTFARPVRNASTIPEQKSIDLFQMRRPAVARRSRECISRSRGRRPIRGAFSRRPLPIAAEEKSEAADELVVDDVEEAEISDDDDTDLDDDTEVEIEVEIDPEDGKVIWPDRQ